MVKKGGEDDPQVCLGGAGCADAAIGEVGLVCPVCDGGMHFRSHSCAPDLQMPFPTWHIRHAPSHTHSLSSPGPVRSPRRPRRRYRAQRQRRRRRRPHRHIHRAAHAAQRARPRAQRPPPCPANVDDTHPAVGPIEQIRRRRNTLSIASQQSL